MVKIIAGPPLHHHQARSASWSCRRSAAILLNIIPQFLVKLILEVLGAAGAIWGFSEAVGFRDESNSARVFRPFALSVGFVFFLRWLRQLREAVRQQQQQQSRGNEAEDVSSLCTSSGNSIILQQQPQPNEVGLVTPSTVAVGDDFSLQLYEEEEGRGSMMVVSGSEATNLLPQNASPPPQVIHHHHHPPPPPPPHHHHLHHPPPPPPHHHHPHMPPPPPPPHPFPHAPPPPPHHYYDHPLQSPFPKTTMPPRGSPPPPCPSPYQKSRRPYESDSVILGESSPMLAARGRRILRRSPQTVATDPPPCLPATLFLPPQRSRSDGSVHRVSSRDENDVSF